MSENIHQDCCDLTASVQCADCPQRKPKAITAAPVVKSFAQSTRDERCLEVWFHKEVTDESRSWLLEAINEKALREGASDATIHEGCPDCGPLLYPCMERTCPLKNSY